MRADLDLTNSKITVTLSRRNLRALLTKLDHDWSAKAIETNEVYVDDELEQEITLRVAAEDDAMHYDQRGFGPGIMHPITELDLATD